MVVQVLSPEAIAPGNLSRYRAAPTGFYLPERESLLYRTRRWGRTPQQRVLAWFRDHVSPDIPRAYYRAVLGHDLHISIWAELYVRHFHREQDWLEDIGRVSCAKVTTAFRDFECANLVVDSTLYGDFKYHEVGLSNAAEANTQTGLQTSTGIARVAGTQTNPTASTYQTVGTIIADATEIWQEHGVFNLAALGTMLDRSIISPVIDTRSGDIIEMTYVLTKAAEA